MCCTLLLIILKNTIMQSWMCQLKIPLVVLNAWYEQSYTILSKCVIIFSLSCSLKPISLLFIFGTQIKIIFIFFNFLSLHWSGLSQYKQILQMIDKLNKFSSKALASSLARGGVILGVLHYGHWSLWLWPHLKSSWLPAAGLWHAWLRRW